MKAGSTLPEIAARRGDFEDWIARGLALESTPVAVVKVAEGESLPDPVDIRAAVVTGSSAMVSDREPWSECTAAWLASLVDRGTPLLAICYGHQLLAHALGGQVERNPRGREIGTVEVWLRAAGDALLGGLPEAIRVHATHVESALRLPDGAVCLGENASDPHHAFRVGERAWGVQFHPEFDADIVRGYIAGRREILLEEGLDPDALTGASADSPHGAALLARFGELVERE